MDLSYKSPGIYKENIEIVLKYFNESYDIVNKLINKIRDNAEFLILLASLHQRFAFLDIGNIRKIDQINEFY